ncbi:hypothetical protein RD792_007438 [Penstemon davidsonii]|uniref:Uncharacterized protein n=1 Tax=Penstemon davidsonii TaxID=160366 RepID=A0ABR0D887_9LAMI|nr:hypothetical protein RD792_007438 [Penstemon davidsonii]
MDLHDDKKLQSMAMDNDNLRALTIAATCILITLTIIKQFFMSPKRKKNSFYLNTEPKPQHAFKRVLADNSYSQFKHLKL